MNGSGPERGILLIDKPAGMTSHDAVQKAKSLVGAERAGHTGTLDSGVTGLLVVALGEARKAVPLLMGLDKGYEGTMRIHGDASLPEVREAARGLTGTITQVPPRKSRVARRPRERRVISFKVTGKDGRSFPFRVRCQAGTYIRKLVHDLGERLGCGAHMASLRRTSVGPFRVEDAVPLEKASTSGIISLEEALERAGAGKVSVKASAVEKARNGVPVPMGEVASGRPKEGEKVGIYRSGRIIAIGTAGKKDIKIDRVFNK